MKNPKGKQIKTCSMWSLFNENQETATDEAGVVDVTSTLT